MEGDHLSNITEALFLTSPSMIDGIDNQSIRGVALDTVGIMNRYIAHLYVEIVSRNCWPMSEVVLNVLTTDTKVLSRV